MTLPSYTKPTYAVGFTSDGKMMLITVRSYKTTFLFDTETGNLLGSIKGHRGYNQSAVFSCDGITLLTGSAEATAYLRTSIFSDAYDWILNNIHCHQAWLIVKAAEAKRQGKPLIIQVGSLEYKHFMDLPEEIQNYLIKWYSLSANIQDCLKQWYSLSASNFPIDCYQTWLIVKATEAHREGKPLVIDKGSFSFEYNVWRGLPAEIKDYLMQQYSVTVSDYPSEA